MSERKTDREMREEEGGVCESFLAQSSYGLNISMMVKN